MVWYFDDQLNRLALVHEYRLPDGSLARRLWEARPEADVFEGEILYC